MSLSERYLSLKLRTSLNEQLPLCKSPVSFNSSCTFKLNLSYRKVTSKTHRSEDFEYLAVLALFAPIARSYFKLAGLECG